jgi:hypothetical protein
VLSGAAEFGAGGDGQLALLTGGGRVPVSPVGHDRREHRLALPVDVDQGLVAAGQVLFPSCFLMIAADADGAGINGGAQAGQAARQTAVRTWRSSSPTYWGAQAVSTRYVSCRCHSIPSGMPRTAGPSAGPRAARASCQAARRSATRDNHLA